MLFVLPAAPADLVAVVLVVVIAPSMGVRRKSALLESQLYSAFASHHHQPVPLDALFLNAVAVHAVDVLFLRFVSLASVACTANRLPLPVLALVCSLG